MTMKDTFKYNPEQVQLRGKATIQLFDESTGELVKEVTKTNYISPHYLRNASKYAPYATIVNEAYNPMPMGGTSNDNNLSNAMRQSGVMRSMILTSANHPVNEEFDIFPKGNLVGYGFINSTNTVPLASVFNTSESIARGDYKKLVYDFATSQGNGTFQSIYTGNWNFATNYDGNPQNTSSGHASLASVHLTDKNAFNNLVNFEYEGEYLYWMARSSDNTDYFSIFKRKLTKINEIVSIYTYNTSPASTDQDALDVQEFFTGLPMYTSSYSSLKIVNGVAYILRGYYASLHSLDLKVAGAKPVALITDMYNPKTTGLPTNKSLNYQYTTGMFYEPKERCLVLGVSTSSHDIDSYFMYVNLDGSIKQMVNVSSAHRVLITRHSKFSVHEPEWLIGGTYPFNPYTMRTGTVYNSNTNSSNWINISHDLTGYLDSTNRLRLHTSNGFFSRVLLEEPVTKTEVNTMKITYEFDVVLPDDRLLEFRTPPQVE